MKDKNEKKTLKLSGLTSSQTTNDELLQLSRADIKTVFEAMDALTMQRATVHQEEGTDNVLIDTARAILEGKRKEKYGPPGEKPNVQADLNMKAVIAFDINPTEYYDPEHRIGSGLQTFALECVEDMLVGGCDFPEKVHIQVSHEHSMMEKELRF